MSLQADSATAATVQAPDASTMLHVTNAIAMQAEVATTLTKAVAELNEQLQNMTVQSERRSRPSGPFRSNCWTCGLYGHVSASCPGKQSSSSQNNMSKQSYVVAPGLSHSKEVPVERVVLACIEELDKSGRHFVAHVMATVDGVDRQCLIDTGAGVSIIPRSLVRPEALNQGSSTQLHTA